MSKQMMILSGGSTGLFLTIAAIVAIAVVTGTNNTMKINSEKALHEQIRRTSGRTIATTAKLVRETLVTSNEGNIAIIAHAMGDTYRTDYSLIDGAVSSILEYGNVYLESQGLVLVSDPRQTKPANFTSSVYYVPGATPSDIPTFSVELNQTRDQAKHMDYFMRDLYQLYPDFVATYIGFANTGMFLTFPAIGTLNTDPTRSYDPRNRGWYQSARDTNSVIITPPYQDFNGKGWMITIAAPVYNVETGAFVGVVGGDMLISSLKSIIDGIKFLETGKVTLFDGDQVVTDRDWNADPTNPNTFSYSDLSTPQINDSLWEDIKSVDAGETKSIDATASNSGDHEYLFIAYRLEDSGLGLSRYILLVSVPEEEITKPINEIIGEMISVNLIIALSYSFGTIGFALIMGLLITWIGRVITKSVDKARSQVEGIAKRLGHASKNMFSVGPADDDDDSEFAEEIGQFQQAGQVMMTTLHDQQAQARADRIVSVGRDYRDPQNFPIPAQMPNWGQLAPPVQPDPSAPPGSASDSDDGDARGAHGAHGASSVIPPYMAHANFNSALPPPPSYAESMGHDLVGDYKQFVAPPAYSGRASNSSSGSDSTSSDSSSS